MVTTEFQLLYKGSKVIKKGAWGLPINMPQMAYRHASWHRFPDLKVLRNVSLLLQTLI